MSKTAKNSKKEQWKPTIDIKPATARQETYWFELGLKLDEDSQIILATGAAGTGKTFLACAKAAELYIEGHVSEILITRPMVEAGQGKEVMGALPGEMDEKFDPWIANVKFMLGEIMTHGKVKNAWGKTIRAEPLAYCRGKTFDNAFIIGDEFQNADWEQTKMLCTRVGKWSKLVLAGDTSQCDLPRRVTSGLDKLTYEVKRQHMPIEIIKFLPADNQRSGISRIMTECFDNAEPTE